MEEWNEYGELEDQIEDQIDIFGDVPISATSAEAHAAAAARNEAQRASLASIGRTASETRHISISDPREELARKKSQTDDSPNPAVNLGDKKNSPLSMAMRQAGAEAAAKAGQKSSSTSGAQAQAATTGKDPTDTTTSAPATAAKLDPDAEEVTQTETAAKTPEQLASQGQKKTSVDKLGGSPEDEGTSCCLVSACPRALTVSPKKKTNNLSTDSHKSNLEQVLDQRRKSSVAKTSSSLANATSIDEADTVSTRPSAVEEPPKTTSTSTSTSADKDAINQREKAIAEEDEDEDEAEAGDSEPVKKAAKVSATDKGEENVLGGTKPQEREAADGGAAGESVGD